MLSDRFLRLFKPIADWILTTARNEFSYSDYVEVQRRYNFLYGSKQDS